MIRHIFAATVLSVLTLPLAAAAPAKGPDLAIGIGGGAVSFTVSADSEMFVGAVIASLSPDLAHFLVGLPPLLTDYVVLGFGAGSFDSAYTLSIPEGAFPPGIMLYAQGVVIDLPTIDSTPVRDFVLDVTVPD